MFMFKELFSNLRKSLFTSLIGLSLMSCGAAVISTAGISGTGIVVGTITAFGSIWVNGVEYDINQASFDVNGVALSGVDGQNQLSVGMVVTLTASNNGDGTGTATSVVYDAAFKGPILGDPILLTDTKLKQLSVVGQTVVISNLSTRFEGVSFDSVAANDIVEISGFVDQDGVIHATLMKKEAEFVPGEETDVELHGVINALDIDAGKFTLNSQPIVFDNNTNLKNFNTLSNGTLVEVEGRYYNDGTVLANEIKLDESVQKEIENSSGQIEIQGLVANLNSTDFSFQLNGITVDYSLLDNAETLVLANGLEVEVRGSMNEGILELDSLKIESEDD